MRHEVQVVVNGLAYAAAYTDASYEAVFLPLLRDLADLHDKLQRRVVVFLAGPPAAGKSTIAHLLERFAKDVCDCALQSAGLDGFHHQNDYLRSHSVTVDGNRVPLANIKGAPETFDTARFAEKLRALHGEAEVSWPVYDRTLHEPREDALLLSAPIVLVEGNWLLLAEEPWESLVPLADHTVFLKADEALLRERAIARKMRGGASLLEAETHYERADGPNIRRVLEHSLPADTTLILSQNGDLKQIV